MSENYDNSGALFKIDRKEKPSHPDYNGSITVNGVEYWLSAWIKTGQKGKFMSLAVKPKEQQRQAERVPASRNTPIDLSDDVPF